MQENRSGCFHSVVNVRVMHIITTSRLAKLCDLLCYFVIRSVSVILW